MTPKNCAPSSWAERQDELLRLARRQLFFIGGAPRSGTTWLQRLLDAHPDISCRGEGLFMQQFATPLAAMTAAWRQAVEAKNNAVFGGAGGYMLPQAEDTEMLLGTGGLLALDRQRGGKSCLAIGEKTPENVFLFPRLKRLFPSARLIAVARDPRDVITSAWHFFRRGEGDEVAKIAFIRSALPSLREGARSMLDIAGREPADCMIVTYERLLAATVPMAAELFRFLGVSDAEAVVADCVARTSFAALSGGRPAGAGQDGSFFRKGVVGDWRGTLTPAMSEMILDELGWMFPRFGWDH